MNTKTERDKNRKIKPEREAKDSKAAATDSKGNPTLSVVFCGFRLVIHKIIGSVRLHREACEA